MISISSAIWTQDGASGIYDYQDTRYNTLLLRLRMAQSEKSGPIKIEYEGSKTGIGDKFIKDGALLFARRNKTCRFTYIGMVIEKVIIRERSQDRPRTPALYALTIGLEVINGVQSGSPINNTIGLGPKKSALQSLGYELKYGEGGGNIQCGLNSIKKIVTP